MKSIWLTNVFRLPKKQDFRFLLISGMARKKLKIKIKLKFSAILWMNSRKFIFSGPDRRSLINISIKEDNTIERVEMISAGFEASSPAGDGRRAGEHPQKNAKLDYRRFHSVRDVMSHKIFLYLIRKISFRFNYHTHLVKTKFVIQSNSHLARSQSLCVLMELKIFSV